jgi:hypothetical protein
MDESKWERYAALGGIWFVVLSVISAFLPGTPPKTDDSVVKIATYFADRSGRIEAAQLLGGLALIGLIWWFGSLWRLMVKAENGQPRMSVVALGGLVMGAALALASGAVTASVALEHQQVAGASKFFLVFSFVLIASAGIGILIHIGAVTSLSYRTHLFAPWVNVVGWVAALLFLIGTIGIASDSSAFGIVGLLGFLVWCVWIVAISLDLWRRDASPVTGAAAMAP